MLLNELSAKRPLLGFNIAINDLLCQDLQAIEISFPGQGLLSRLKQNIYTIPTCAQYHKAFLALPPDSSIFQLCHIHPIKSEKININDTTLQKV